MMETTNFVNVPQFALGLDLVEETTFDDWRVMGRALCRGQHMLNWLIGDWLDFGSRKYSEERAKEEALQIFRRDEVRLDDVLKTCRLFPKDQRRDSLSFGHHQAVAKLAQRDRSLAEQMLDQAQRDHVTVRMLQAQVSTARDTQEHLPHREDDLDPDDKALRMIVQAWNNWPRGRAAFLELAAEAKMGVIDL